MSLFASAKQQLDLYLPPRHQGLLAGLCCFLILLGLLDSPPEASQTKPVPSLATNSTSDTPAVPDRELMIGPLVPDDYTPPPQSGADTRQMLVVKPGDSLSLIFRRAGLGPQEVAAVTANRDHARILTNLYPGNRFVFDLRDDSSLQSLELIKTPLESYLLTEGASGTYQLEHIEKQPEVRQVFRQAVISDSLFLAAQRNDISDALAMDMAFIFNGVVDFILDTREGDSFSILYEELYLHDEYIGDGRVLAAEFVNQGHRHVALRYENASGESNFYSPEGESMRKAFLLNPVDFTRISSGFTTSRKHPILNTIRAHKGTDYAAPRGTPIVATADGRITFANRNGSFGKLVVIKHNDRFETKYAHLNDYGKGIKVGTRVKQGQVIGYVGATGSATGPHLHYEFLMDGVQRDSRRIFDQLPKALSLEKSELPRFAAQTQPIFASLTAQSQTTALAMSTLYRGTGE